MKEPEKLLQEMTPEEYENLTGQKKPPDESTPSRLSEPSITQSTEPTMDDELGPYGGDSAEQHE
jgi:hypothetical protein